MRILMIGPGAPNEANSGLGVAVKYLTRHLKEKAHLTVIEPTHLKDSKKNRDKTIKIDTEHFTEDVLVKDIVKLQIMSNISSYLYSTDFISHQQKEQTSNKVKNTLDTFTKEVIDVGKKIDYDIIYAHDWVSFEAATTLKQLSNKPLVLHVHSLDIDRFSGSHRSWIYELEKKSFQTADAIVSVSVYTATRIQQYYGINKNKIHTVYNGYTHRTIPKVSNPFKYPIILFVGRLTHQKGTHTFIDMAKKVLKKRPKVKFFVVGAGDMLGNMLEMTAQNEIGDHFHFMGYLTRNKLQEIYALSNIYCMPSVSDPFGLTAIEATDAGLPVVISKQVGALEVLPGAFSADYNDVNTFAKHILTLLDKKEEYEKNIQKNQKSIAMLSWDKAAYKINDIFKTVIK